MQGLAKALDRDLVIFDLETTGVNVGEDRIVQFAAKRITPDGTERSSMSLLIDPGVPIPKEASEIHGISNDDVRGKPRFSDVVDDIDSMMASADLAGYNFMSFDLPMLQAEFDRANRQFIMEGRRFIDGLELFYKYEKRNLEAALRFYCDEDHDEAHDAMADVVATQKVIAAQLVRYADHAEQPMPQTIAEIHQLCMGDRLTLDGKVGWNDNEAVITFGKWQGKSLQWMVQRQRGYLSWMIKSDFPDETKCVLEEAFRGVYPKRKVLTTVAASDVGTVEDDLLF